MDDLFKSDNYIKNLSSLIQVIKLKDTKKVDKQYNETVRDLSQALKDFTNKAEDVAKFVIYTDLNNYVEPVDRKPLGLFGALRGIWDTVLRKDVPVKNDNIRNFIKDKLPNPALEKAAEYTNVLRKINLLKERLDTLKEILDSGRSKKEEHKPHEVNLERATTSKQKKEKQLPKRKVASSRIKKEIKRPTTAPPQPPTANELKTEPQEKVATTKKKVRFKSEPEVILFDDSGYGSLSDEESDKKISNYQEKESICATVPKEHIEAKGANKQQLSKPTIPPKPKSADQQVSTKPRIVGVTPKKSAESKPTVPLKSESQDRRQSAQKAADKAAPKVKVVAMKEEVKSKKGGRVKSMVGKIEQDQAAASKTTPVAQADIGVKKDPAPSPKAASQSRSFPAGNERSETNPITAKSDPKPPVSKKPLLTHVSVKEIAAQFESHGGKK